MKSVVTGLLIISTSAASSEANHPTVSAAANMIDIEVRSNTDYFGALYIG